MFAVIKTGGKQYKVAKDQIVTVEKLAGESGDIVALEDVLMVGDGDKATLGTPLVVGAIVAAEVVEQTRGPRLVVFKKKRRKTYRRRNTHRQDLTVLRITEILTDGKKPAAKAKAKAKAKPKAEEKAEVEAPKEKAEAKTEAKKPAEKKAPAKKAAPKKPAAKKAAPKTESKAKKAPAKADKPEAADKGEE